MTLPVSRRDVVNIVCHLSEISEWAELIRHNGFSVNLVQKITSDWNKGKWNIVAEKKETVRMVWEVPGNEGMENAES